MATLQLSPPTNFNVQSANQQILLTWDAVTGATSYSIFRSENNKAWQTIATVSGSPFSPSYLDTSAVLNTAYYYKISAVDDNGDFLASLDTTVAGPVIATQVGEYSLSQLRLQAQQKADRVNSNFVSFTEWNSFINRAYFELYDLLITLYEDYFIATPIQFTTNGSSQQYPLPDGSTSYMNGLNPSQTFVAPQFYKLIGVDLAIQSSATGYVTVNRFNFIERNRFVYPNSASTIYGVFNCQYRIMGNNLQFIPTPSGNQQFRVWYIPRLTMLLQDTDTTVAGVSGWTEYIVTRAAIYALNKEESDTTLLTQELMMLKQRIEETAANRDAGQADKISDTRANSTVWGGNGGPNWSGGGF